MDGFQLTVIAQAFSHQQWRDDPARHERRRTEVTHFLVAAAGVTLVAAAGLGRIWAPGLP